MARTPSMSVQECEQVLGARGSLRVTTENRTIVRKWLSAQDFPALFSGGLSMRELELAYNKTDGSGIAALKKKLGETTSALGDEASDISEAINASQQAHAAANLAEKHGDFDVPGGVKGNTVAPASANAPTASNIDKEAALDGAMGQMRQTLAALLATPQVDEAAIEKIADRVSRQNDTPIIDTIETVSKLLTDKMAEFEANNGARVVKVELKSGDSVREIEGIAHPSFERLLKSAASRQADGFHPNIWIAGPAGSGKTFGARQVAEAMGLQFEYNGALSMPHELLGFRDAGGAYHDTAFRRAYTGKSVYLFDEVDGSDNTALLALNAALANGRASFPDGQHERHKDSVIIATANTWGLGATADYVGRAKIDAAFLSRFPVRIFWDYDAEMEKQICGNAKWAERVQGARAKARAAGIKVLIDPRASIAGAALIETGFTEKEAAEMTYLANLTPEQKQMVDRA